MRDGHDGQVHDWDARYAEQEQLWSGQPNGALVAEVATMQPGRVLDVGCGEGADAIWLAARGWEVTALDVSGVALARAAKHAEDAGVGVTWLHAGLLQADLDPPSYDLVSAQYFVLPKTAGRDAERTLLSAVGDGGTLLAVHHVIDEEHARDSGFDPTAYVSVATIAELLDDDWLIEVNEQRPRAVPDGGAGAHHADDVVLRARRLR
jgi:SAM-dependent methyltransferase